MSVPSRTGSAGAIAPQPGDPNHDEMWEAVFEHAPLGMAVFDSEIRILRANAAMADILGSTSARMAGRLLPDFTHADDRARADEMAQRLFRREAPWVTIHHRCVRDDGQIVWCECVCRIFWSPSGEFQSGLALMRDVTESVRAESALLESLAQLEQTQARLQLADRMASMGTLAAGVAHEINNPLGFVVANLGFAQEEVAAMRSGTLSADELDKRLAALTWALGEAQEGANRVRNIVLDLRTFSHPDTELRTLVDPRRVIEAALTLAHGEIKTRAKIIRRFQPVPPVIGNETRLSQLFLNLIVDAAHAIPVPPGGTATGSHAITVAVSEAPEHRVLVEVSDTGPGLAPGDLARTFDPFFITKRPVGLGSGLGLSISHSIVRSLGGEITVQTTPGGGRTFRVLLPAAAPGGEETSEPAPAVAVGDARKSRRARILVVDDEPLMGSAMERVLSDHEVVALTSARAALARIEGGERFDVILCDVMMPDMDGMELHTQLSQRVPEMVERLVFVTGGAFTTDAIEFLERVPNLRLEKPMLPEVLHLTLARILEAAKPSP